VVEWRVTASQPSAGIEGVDAAVLPITDDHAIGTIELRPAGDWTIRFELRFDEFTNGIVETTLRVAN
jgi:copper transport protein